MAEDVLRNMCAESRVSCNASAASRVAPGVCVCVGGSIGCGERSSGIIERARGLGADGRRVVQRLGWGCMLSLVCIWSWCGHDFAVKMRLEMGLEMGLGFGHERRRELLGREGGGLSGQRHVKSQWRDCTVDGSSHSSISVDLFNIYPSRQTMHFWPSF